MGFSVSAFRVFDGMSSNVVWFSFLCSGVSDVECRGRCVASGSVEAEVVDKLVRLVVVELRIVGFPNRF